MTTKTKTQLHPLLQEILDAFPEDMREATEDARALWGSDDDRLDIPHAGYIELDDFAPAQGVMLRPSCSGRSRRYPIRKDGTINVKKIVEVTSRVFYIFDEIDKKREAEEAAREAKEQEDQRLAEVIAKKVQPGSSFEIIENTDSYSVGAGFRLRLKGDKNRVGAIHATDEDHVVGTIPFKGSVERLNEILKLLGTQS